MQLDLAKIADKLTTGQNSTVRNLDTSFAVLGCSEPYAIRLCHDGIRRPALVESRKGKEFREFRLTPIGVAVKLLLEDQCS